MSFMAVAITFIGIVVVCAGIYFLLALIDKSKAKK
jgi:uncharacterized membrane protein YsdA (DUF1294 family)